MRYLSLVLILLALTGCAGRMTHSNLITQQNSADQAYAIGNYEVASKLYRSLAKELPTDAGIRYQLGNSLARQGDAQGAMESYREALVRDPQHARAWHNLLQVQLRMAVLTAGEMRQTLNAQQPMADGALQLGERLLGVFPPARQTVGEEP